MLERAIFHYEIIFKKLLLLSLIFRDLGVSFVYFLKAALMRLFYSVIFSFS